MPPAPLVSRCSNPVRAGSAHVGRRAGLERVAADEWRSVHDWLTAHWYGRG
ncbi:hypothetical protein [Natrinema halophilum]|uniref:Uncharacterized protein n=1 Tax=Natrinema halophilum TaxID=1699371 RepID=A0A7D5KZQ4_9EURY|nr:hypothetical protein [Natrinema halophilum]QLG49820.1 hypothetical protein HYG82_13600 [Natrinema halophilum]